jgi:hypothetical protein
MLRKTAPKFPIGSDVLGHTFTVLTFLGKSFQEMNVTLS